MAGDGADPRAAAIPGLYERTARAFEQARADGGWPDRAWHERLAGMLAPGAAVLDLGCGPGAPVTRFLAGRGFRISGVDSSLAMIALCRARLPAHEWQAADMRTLALGRRFDAVLAWDSFFHLPHDDQRHMLRVFADHANPGAPLLFNTGVVHGIAIGTWQGEPLYHASLDVGEYRALLDAAGFKIVAHAVEDREAGGRTVWLARRRPLA